MLRKEEAPADFCPSLPAPGWLCSEFCSDDIKVQHQLRHEALDAAEAGLPGSLVAKRPGQLGQADRLHGAERSERHGKAFDVGKIHRRFENR